MFFIHFIHLLYKYNLKLLRYTYMNKKYSFILQILLLFTSFCLIILIVNYTFESIYLFNL